MGMEDGAQYLIREYALPLDRNGYLDVMREVIAQLYEKVELKPGVRDTLARLRAEGARMCICSNTWRDVYKRQGHNQDPSGCRRSAAQRREASELCPVSGDTSS